MSFFGSTRSSRPTATASASNQATPDHELADPPTDSVSSLSWSPQGGYLAVGSWDSTVRIYEANAQGSQGRASYTHQAPVLSTCWSKDGTKVISGGADNAARAFDVQTGQCAQAAQHDAPIKSVKWVDTPHGGILATGSWDKTLKYWDLRQAAPVLSVSLSERCYAMDVQYPLLVVGCAERKIDVINLTNPGTIYKTVSSPLKWQTRTLACFPQANGFAVGSVEGRVAVHYVEDKDVSMNYSFKCHRRDNVQGAKDGSLIYAVNEVNFHPIHGTLSSSGSDGTVHYWDLDAQMRIKSFEPVPGPVVASAFNADGTLFAYSVSYDWSKGHAGATGACPNRVMVHACKAEEVQKRKPRARGA